MQIAEICVQVRRRGGEIKVQLVAQRDHIQ